MTRALFASTIVALFLVACAAEESSLTGGPGGEPDPAAPGTDPGAPNPAAPGTPAPGAPVPGACEASVHVGFGKTDFVADRKPGEIGTNRRRVKPYSALSTEFKRALGQAPTALTTSTAAFGELPPRWFAEPGEGAVSLYTMYTLSFQSCYDSMTAAGYAVAPTAATAPTECATMQRKFWQRTATPDETKACADLVLGLTTETNPRRQWAHGCASILTSTGFTTY